MANNVTCRGLDPEWRQGSSPETAKFSLKSTLTTYGCFKNSAYIIIAGVADMCAVGGTTPATAPASKGITGSVVMIYGADGFPIHNISTAATGATIEGTIDENQKFRILSAAAVLSVAVADIGKGGNLTAEGSTAGTATYGSLASYGSNYSDRRIGGVADAATLLAQASVHDPAAGSQLIILERTPQIFGNEFTAAAADGTVELWVKINPLVHVI